MRIERVPIFPAHVETAVARLLGEDAPGPESDFDMLRHVMSELPHECSIALVKRKTSEPRGFDTDA